MEIQPIQQPSTQPVTPSQGVKPADAQATPQNNQALLAQVLKQFPGTNFISVKLLSSQQTLQIENTQNLKPGQLVQLTSEGSELKLQSNAKQTADQILRLLLPRQGSVKEALTALLKTLNTENQSSVVKKDSAINLEAKRLVNNIVRDLPQRGEIIKPTILKQLIQNTGLLSSINQSTSAKSLTKNLATPGLQTKTIGESLIPILKSLLLSNPKSIDTKVQETSARLADLIARVMLSQMRPLNRLEGEEIDTRRTELLARSDNQLDSFHIQFSAPKPGERKEHWDKNSEDQNSAVMERKWTVRLNFDFQALGSITAIIVLSAEKRLEMNFWSERPETLMLINQHRRNFQDQLQKKMQVNGIELSMAVFEGKAPQQDTHIQSQLINEKV